MPTSSAPAGTPATTFVFGTRVPMSPRPRTGRKHSPGNRERRGPNPGVPAMTHPGDVLGLQSQDISLPSSPTLNSVTLTNPVDHSTVTASYLSGDDGVLVNPGEPVLPLEIKNVTVSGTVLRGVRFLGGTYSDINDVLPLTGAPVTEIRGVHAPFLSEVFYPIQ